VSEDDAAVLSENIEVMSDGAKVFGYLAHPSQELTKRRPIVLVCSENRGLTPHIKDMIRRLARAGFCAVSVDLLSREGGTAKLDADAIPGILGKAPAERPVQDFKAALEFAKTKAFARAKDSGMIGFCFGGGVTWRAAIGIPELRAAIPFYGPPPALDDIPKIKAAVLAIYAGNDTRINAGLPGIEAAMKKNGKTFEKIIFPGVDHAFNNDTGARYNQNAALQAWEKSLAWLNLYLKPS
jgi:carboxymethylenebutenolidase